MVDREQRANCLNFQNREGRFQQLQPRELDINSRHDSQEILKTMDVSTQNVKCRYLQACVISSWF